MIKSCNAMHNLIWPTQTVYVQLFVLKYSETSEDITTNRSLQSVSKDFF